MRTSYLYVSWCPLSRLTTLSWLVGIRSCTPLDGCIAIDLHSPITSAISRATPPPPATATADSTTHSAHSHTVTMRVATTVNTHTHPGTPDTRLTA